MTPLLLNNRYQVIQTLGSGGFGTTFLAEDTQMPSRRRCVIKQLKPITNNPEVYKLVQERFQREAAILEELGDGNSQIPRLYAYFAEAGEFYLIQEWIEGVTLRDRIQTEGIVGEAQVKQILIDILPVLTYVHDKRIVHRDIKPDNIILRKRDGKPVLIDFGAVRETMGTVVNSQGQSASSIVIGTPGFMPSEQAAGRPMYSSDLYSLGLTMIYLLTGKFPQELDLDPQTGEVIWRQHAPTMSADLLAVLDKSIQYHPRDRYATAQDMLVALQGTAEVASSPIVDRHPLGSSVPPTVAAPTIAQAPGTQDLPATIINSPQPRPSQPNVVQGEFNQIPSGSISPSDTRQNLPDEVPGWNWGAFLLPGLWCINNQVWIGLLSWSGFVTGMLGWLAGGFVLGVKGNEWAWKSRRWRSLEDFKRNQRHWAIGGIVTWGSLVGLITAIAIFVPPAPESSSNDFPSGNGSNSPEEQSTGQTTNVFGTSESLSPPDTYIDGTWNLNYTLGDQSHQATLLMQGVTGTLTVKSTGPAGSTQTVQQTMQLWSAPSGLMVLGYNPTDSATQAAKTDYPADNFLFQPQADGSMVVKSCNDAGACGDVAAELLATP
ncbi:serine/threonine protein kinase [Oscillatoria sp. FACHB-1407]|uniref:serine/threonine-protein kinase n=1 Tax=Oscillatoria sp. FACHB-1407 TaxID=2692847 RepID=UPI001682BDF8|nr:serine/threonine-protein kinase [Oscillatoria sp. FACHB-1407]MBD2461029.1 serine/threonine protein kinase [Oscillatoria sp. FACHB-1407]